MSLVKKEKKEKESLYLIYDNCIIGVAARVRSGVLLNFVVASTRTTRGISRLADEKDRDLELRVVN